jgi:RimJ/RimL family protein N-acetyltransferase
MGEQATEAREAPIINIFGEKVCLGPPRREDIPVHARWLNDFFVLRTFGEVPRPRTIERQTVSFESASASDDSIRFTIYETGSWRPVGNTTLFEIDHFYGTATFGLLIGEADARGKGYGTEVARLMLDYAFTALGLHNVLLDVDEFNLAGRKAYERAGFKEIGRRREVTRLSGRRWDLIFMDCLAHEFESTVLAKVFRPDE